MANDFRMDLIDPFNMGNVETTSIKDPFSLQAAGLAKPKKKNVLEQVVAETPKRKAAKIIAQSNKKKRSFRDRVADALFAASRGITAQTGITSTPGTAVGIGVLKGLRGISDLLERDRVAKLTEQERAIKEAEAESAFGKKKELAKFRAGLRPTAEEKAAEAALIAEAKLPAKRKSLQFATQEIDKRNRSRMRAAASAGLTEKQSLDLMLKAEKSIVDTPEYMRTLLIQDPIQQAKEQQDIVDRKFKALISSARGSMLQPVKQPVKQAFELDVSGL